jgi:hypothetical protein
VICYKIGEDACQAITIAPWWKPWRRLAWKGRRFERIAEVIEAIMEATAYWNAHRYPYVWKKAA